MHMLSSPKQRCCAYALAIQRWQYSAGNTALAIHRWQYSAGNTTLPRNCPATAPATYTYQSVSIRINPVSMTARNTFAKQRGPKNNKNHSPACLHVCWQRLKNAKKHQKTTWAAKTNLKKLEEDMFCSDAKTP